jgi:hypothetical protein
MTAEIMEGCGRVETSGGVCGLAIAIARTVDNEQWTVEISGGVCGLAIAIARTVDNEQWKLAVVSNCPLATTTSGS